jgi:hypothetical protein
MFSKKYFVLLFATILVSCTEFINDKRDENKPADTVVIVDKDLEDLKLLPSYIKSFLKDELSEKDLDKPFKLLDRALHKLGSMVSCSSIENACTDKEMQHFFNSYLLTENQISDEFLSEIMKAKAAIVGGSNKAVSKEEIVQLQKFLITAKGQAVKLLGSMRELTFKSERPMADPTKILKLIELSHQVSKSMLAATSLAGSNYSFGDARNFVLFLGRFIDDPEQLEAINKWMPLIESVKNLFFGEQQINNSFDQLENSRKWSVDLYGLGLKFFYQIFNPDFNKPKTWDVIFPLVEEGFELMERAPMMQRNGGFKLSYFDQIIDELSGKGIVDLNFSAQLIKETFKKFLLYCLEGRGGMGRSINELEYFKQEHLNVLKDEYSVWKVSQKFVIDTIGEKGSVPMKLVQQRAKKFKPQNVLFKFKNRNIKESSEIVNQGFKDWIDLLTKDFPMILTEDFRVAMTPKMHNQKVSIYSMTVMNTVKTFTRMVFKGYGLTHADSHKVMQRTLTEERFMAIESEFKEFGIAVKFLDPRVESSAKRAFKEANFFTFNGNGNQILSATEFYELVNMMVSAGLTMANQMYDDLKKINCLEGQDLDVFEHHFANQNCFIDLFMAQYSKYFVNMPKMVTFLSTLSEADRRLFATTLLKVSEQEDDNRVEYGELRLFNGIGQYVEAVTTVFDVNKDGLFSSAELSNAFPRFKSFIEFIAAQESWVAAQFPERIFLYLVYYGQKPDGFDLLVGYPFYPGDNVTRMNIVKTLGILRSSASK